MNEKPKDNLLGILEITDHYCTETITLGLSLLAAIVVVNWYWGGPRRLPPGPRGLPFLGMIPFLGKTPYETLTKIAKDYKSPIFSMYLGSKLVIVLNDFESIKEAFIKKADIFAGRPEVSNMNVKCNDNQSLSTKEGQFWKSHRNLLINTLKSHSVEDRVMDEIQRFVTTLRSLDGHVTDLRGPIELSVMSNICTFALGCRFDYKDPDFESIRRAAKRLMMAASSVGSATYLPRWLRRLPGIPNDASGNLEALLKQLYKDLQKQIDKKKSVAPSIEGGDFVEAYRAKLESPENEYFTEAGLLHNTRLVMTAGTEPTANALQWGLLYLTRWPEVQRRVQEELDRVVGQHRCPSYSDQPRTPYTEATICEVLRLASIMPISLLHSNKEDCILSGYRIPKRSYIMANFWNVHHDPSLWDDPLALRPERFLTPDNTVLRPENFIPFSAGKRQCPGEYLGRMELYLYFTTLLQNFTFESPDRGAPSLEPVVGLHLVPRQVEARVISRS